MGRKILLCGNGDERWPLSYEVGEAERADLGCGASAAAMVAAACGSLERDATPTRRVIKVDWLYTTLYTPSWTPTLYWVGPSREDLRDLPEAVRRELGFDLRRVQLGAMPRDWKAMASVGSGVVEIRVRLDGAYRLMYVAKFAEAIYVLHVFQKKSQKTAAMDIEVARARLKAVRRDWREG